VQRRLRPVSPRHGFGAGPWRWFPDLAVRIWTELHEFERAGLVTEYFRQRGGFKDLSTLSVCG